MTKCYKIKLTIEVQGIKDAEKYYDENFSDYNLVIGSLVDGYLSWRTLKMYSRHQITYEEAINI